MAIDNLTHKKSKGLGIAFLVAAVLLFLLWWVYLLEVAQPDILRNIAELGRPAHFLAHTFTGILVGFIVGGIFGLLTYLGFSFLKFWWQKWSNTLDGVDWYDVFHQSAAWLWITIAGAGFALFTYFWVIEL